jgi:arsenite/tail-anchored protein-transporting ATPase
VSAASPRVLLFTGKGGVGKSTVAAGTAALAADQGLRTLVISTDAAHSLADAFGVARPGPEPVPVGAGLHLHQVDGQRRFEESWSEISRYLRSVLDAGGADPVTAEELTVLPGAEEVLALLELRLHARTGAWDVIVVDCAPTAETLRLLALPEALGWYLAKVFPRDRAMVRALAPVLGRAAGVPMPEEGVLDAVTRLHGELDDVRSMLAGPRASVRLVMTPEKVVLAEARRLLTTLSLFGYRVDGVVVNRVFPEAGADEWRARWVAAQRQVLEQAAQSFAGLPLWRSCYQEEEPVGRPALTSLADELYAGGGALTDPEGPEPLRFGRRGSTTTLRLSLPFVDRSDVDLTRHGDELAVTVATYRRLLTLPAALARHTVTGARVVDGELQVRFEESMA